MHYHGTLKSLFGMLFTKYNWYQSKKPIMPVIIYYQLSCNTPVSQRTENPDKSDDLTAFYESGQLYNPITVCRN